MVLFYGNTGEYRSSYDLRSSRDASKFPYIFFSKWNFPPESTHLLCILLAPKQKCLNCFFHDCISAFLCSCLTQKHMQPICNTVLVIQPAFVFFFLASCTHLGMDVFSLSHFHFSLQRNVAEGGWGSPCPCHPSRYPPPFFSAFWCN